VRYLDLLKALLPAIAADRFNPHRARLAPTGMLKGT
jgi:hypothetical protein